MAAFSRASTHHTVPHGHDCGCRGSRAGPILRRAGPLAAGDPLGALVFVRGPLGGSLIPQLAARPRLSMAGGVQGAARLAVWFVGGIGLAIGMRLTAMALGSFRMARWPAWWIAGLGFIGIELVADLPYSCAGGPASITGVDRGVSSLLPVAQVFRDRLLSLHNQERPKREPAPQPLARGLRKHRR